MPRSNSSSRSSSRSSSSRTQSRTASTHAPPVTQNRTQQAQQQAHQPQKSGMMSGMMGALATGAAFGVGSEMIRGFFGGHGGHGGNGSHEGQEGYGSQENSTSIGSLLIPLALSGAAAYGSNKTIFANLPRKNIYSALVFGGVFLVSSSVFGNKPQGPEGYQGAQY